ncbi:hypothetical protein [Pseudoxanthomonas suwonensis]|nr:hypothetical protein [Pseudoxanthomonas suwonensis]
MTRDDLAEDLAYVRTLAEEGRNAPLIGGRYLVLFGALLTIAYGMHWALIAGAFGPTHWTWILGNWSGFAICAGIGSLMVGRRVRALPGRAAVVNRVDGAVWRGAALAIVAVVVGSVAHDAINDRGVAQNAIMAVGFAVYGVALGATAVIAQQAWLRWFSWLSFVASAVLWTFLNEPWAYLVAAAASVAVLLAPGLVMMRGEPSRVV